MKRFLNHYGPSIGVFLGTFGMGVGVGVLMFFGLFH
jgi:hypothetical protein